MIDYNVPYIGFVSWAIAANSEFFVLATATKPSGKRMSLSKWLM